MESTQSVDRIVTIIDAVASFQSGCTLSDVLEVVDLPKTTVYRTLNALASHGYLLKSPQGLYKVGYRFLLLSKQYLGSLDIREIAAPHLRSMVAEYSVTAHIAVLQQDKAIYIEKIKPFSFECVYSDIGKTIDLYCSGLGKSLLLGVGQDVLLRYADTAPYQRYTATTLDREGLLHELEVARKTGYTVDNSEHEEGVYCIAAPIYDYTGKVIAAISVSKPDQGILGDCTLITRVIHSAGAISMAMGYTD